MHPRASRSTLTILRYLARRGVVHLSPEAGPPPNYRKVTRLRASPQVELFE